MKRKIWTLGLGAAAAVVLLLVAAASPSTVVLSGVDNRTLASQGISLAKPANLPDGLLAEDKATALARAEIPSASVLDATIASVTDSSQPGVRDRLVWVVSLGSVRVTGHAATQGGARAAYTLVFLDATDGSLLFGVQYGGF
jgi:hypothetical protein